MDQDDHTRVLLSDCLGKRVSAVRRLFYAFRGEVDRTEGDLIIVFEDGSHLHFTGRSDGCGVRVTGEPYQDRFTAPSSQDEAWIAQHGRWVETELRPGDPHHEAVGQALERLTSLEFKPHGQLCGLGLHFSGGMALYVYDVSDQVRVSQEVDPAALREQPW